MNEEIKKVLLANIGYTLTPNRIKKILEQLDYTPDKNKVWKPIK